MLFFTQNYAHLSVPKSFFAFCSILGSVLLLFYIQLYWFFSLKIPGNLFLDQMAS